MAVVVGAMQWWFTRKRLPMAVLSFTTKFLSEYVHVHVRGADVLRCYAVRALRGGAHVFGWVGGGGRGTGCGPRTPSYA